MGSQFTDWSQATGAMYMGAGTNMEVIWLTIAAVLCVVALIVGSVHEHDSYKRIRK